MKLRATHSQAAIVAVLLTLLTTPALAWDAQVRVYEDTLTSHAQAIDATGSEGIWAWSVVAPRFDITAQGVTLSGVLIADGSVAAPVQYAAVPTRSGALQFRPVPTRQPVRPVQLTRVFELPVELDWTDGTLRVDVGGQNVSLSAAGEQVVSVDVGALFSGALTLGPLGVLDIVGLDVSLSQLNLYNGLARLRFDVQAN